VPGTVNRRLFLTGEGGTTVFEEPLQAVVKNMRRKSI